MAFRRHLRRRNPKKRASRCRFCGQHCPRNRGVRRPSWIHSDEQEQRLVDLCKDANTPYRVIGSIVGKSPSAAAKFCYNHGLYRSSPITTPGHREHLREIGRRRSMRREADAHDLEMMLSVINDTWERERRGSYASTLKSYVNWYSTYRGGRKNLGNVVELLDYLVDLGYLRQEVAKHPDAWIGGVDTVYYPVSAPVSYPAEHSTGYAWPHRHY